MQKLKFRLTLTSEMLGTKAANKDLFADYIASKAPDDDKRREELETAAHKEEAGTTVFHRASDGTPIIWNYQMAGMFKEACGSLRQSDDAQSKELKAYKTKIDGLVFVSPRQLRLSLPPGTQVGICERPLRADTAQGPRVALARSETVPEGTTLEFEVTVLKKELIPLIREWLEYGSLRGLGQWRNSGRGTFTFEELTT